MSPLDWALLAMMLGSWAVTGLAIYFAVWQCREIRRLTNLLVARYQPTLREVEQVAAGQIEPLARPPRIEQVS